MRKAKKNIQNVTWYQILHPNLLVKSGQSGRYLAGTGSEKIESTGTGFPVAHWFDPFWGKINGNGLWTIFWFVDDVLICLNRQTTNMFK